MIQPLQNFLREFPGVPPLGRWSAFWRSLLRLAFALCIVSIFIGGIQRTVAIHHDHDRGCAMATTGQDTQNHHDDHEHSNGDSEGQHHHHVIVSGSGAIISYDSAGSALFLISSRTPALALRSAVPEGPVFDIIKPPQIRSSLGLIAVGIHLRTDASRPALSRIDTSCPDHPRFKAVMRTPLSTIIDKLSHSNHV